MTDINQTCDDTAGDCGNSVNVNTCPSLNRDPAAVTTNINDMIETLYGDQPECKTKATLASGEIMAKYEAKASAGFGAASAGVSAQAAASYLDTSMESAGCTSSNTFSNQIQSKDEDQDCNMLNSKDTSQATIRSGSSITVDADCAAYIVTLKESLDLAYESQTAAIDTAIVALTTPNLSTQQLDILERISSVAIKSAANNVANLQEAIESPCLKMTKSVIEIKSEVEVTSSVDNTTDLANELQADYETEVRMTAENDITSELGFQSLPASASNIITNEIKNDRTSMTHDIKNIVTSTKFDVSDENAIKIVSKGPISMDNVVIDINTVARLAQQQVKTLAARKAKELSTKVLLGLASENAVSTSVTGADDFKRAQGDVIAAMGKAMPPLDLGGGMEEIIGAIVLLIVLVVGGYLAYQYFQNK
jgi:hypothetical protein